MNLATNPNRNTFTTTNIGDLYFKRDVKTVPIIMAGTAIPATNAIPTGAPIKVPSCHNNFFFLDQGFLPQNVQPEGLQKHH